MTLKGLDGVVIFSPENLRYLTGFSGEASYGLITHKNMYLVTDYRFADQANAECVGVNIICRDRDRQTLGDVFKCLLSGENAKNVGVETEHLSHDIWVALHFRLSDFNTVPTKGLIETLRICKDSWEISQIQEAALIADTALEALLGQIELGVSERDLARELDYLIKSYGADDVSFPTILGFGANSAKPHCVPSQRPLMSGDFVLIDFGAMVNGYRSDMTRTFVAGKPSDQQTIMMKAVLRAQEVAIAAVRPGISGRELDQEAIRVLNLSPFKKYAGKGLGHGVGLKLHERPFLGPNCDEVLQAGCIVTIEPGLYIPQYGGVRYEDDILVQDTGAKCLTKAAKFFELEV